MVLPNQSPRVHKVVLNMEGFTMCSAYKIKFKKIVARFTVPEQKEFATVYFCAWKISENVVFWFRFQIYEFFEYTGSFKKQSFDMQKKIQLISIETITLWSF